jgi:hypothetical protein
MKLYCADVKFNTISNLNKKKLVDETTLVYLKENQLLQDETTIWRYGVLEKYDELYVGVLINDMIKRVYMDEGKKTTSVIVSYMVINKKRGSPFRFIELIDTFISGNNLALKMIHAYTKQYRKKILPNHIIPTSVLFWKKYIKENFNLETRSELEDFVKRYMLDNYVSWIHLYNTL